MLCVSLLLIGCNNTSEKQLELELTQSTLEKNIAMYETVWNKVINDRQIDLINEDSFDKDVTALATSGGDITGLENFKNYYNNYLTGFSDAEFKIVDIFGQGDKMVKHWNFKGTHDGDFFGVPATGKSVDISGTTLIKMKDGKIAAEQDYMDFLSFYTQLGLLSHVKLSYSLLDNIVPKDSEVFNNLVNITESIDVDSQSNWITGKAKNMVIRRNANSITVQGSLPKYKYGNNLQTLQRADIGLIIDELSDLISIDLSKARLQRIDFSTNIITEHKPQYYYRFLGHLTRFYRHSDKSSLYYNQGCKKLLFYDKIKDARAKQMPIPQQYQNKNVLRYEMRLVKQVKKFFKRDVLAKDLTDKQLYNYLLDKWYEYYKEIEKQKSKINIMSNQITSPKDFDKQLLIGLVQSLGYSHIDDVIEQMKTKNVFHQREYYSRLKSKYRRLSKVDISDEDVISEIDMKINEVVLTEKSM